MPISVDRRHRAFEQAISYDAFVDATVNHTAAFREQYEHTQLTAAELGLAATITGPVDVLAIVEDWCPDVVATLPILAHLADAAEGLTLHVLVRGDDTRDVADAYPFEGRSHIPTYVLSGADGQDLGVFVERTPEIGAAAAEFLEAYFAEFPEVDRATFPASLDPAAREELVRRHLALRAGLRDLERSTLVRDLTAIATGAAVPAVPTTAPATPAPATNVATAPAVAVA